MPNHVKNRLEIIGSDKDVQNVLSFIKGDNYDNGSERYIDFNKIVTMPEDLNVSPHSGIEVWVEIVTGQCDFKSAIQKSVGRKSFGDDLVSNGAESMLSYMKSSTALEYLLGTRDKKSVLDLNDEEFDTFLKCVSNVRKYGFISWYNWACKIWGTKWNAYEQEKLSANTIQFETAWNSVIGLIEKLSKKFPSVKLYYMYADEDTGSNCGEGYVENVVSDIKMPESCSKEAYELAFKLRPDHKDDYVLKNGTYVYKED